jgi:putative colanic acid biosynthesis UDP-glucose lipid carrier transferase
MSANEQARPVLDGGREEAGLSLIRWTHGLVNRSIRLSDMLLVLAAGGIFHSFLMSGQGNVLSWLQAFVISLVEVTIFLTVTGKIGAYRVENFTTIVRPLAHLAVALLATWAGSLVLLTAFAPGYVVEFEWFLQWHGLQLLLLVASRQVQRGLIRMIERQHLLQRKVVVIGANPVGEEVVRDLTAAPRASSYKVVGVFRDRSDDVVQGQIGGAPMLGDLKDLTTYAQDHTIDTIVLALPWKNAPDIFRLIEAVEWIAADVVIPFEEAGVRPGFARIASLGSASTLQVMYRPFKGSQGVLKQLEDYVIALVALLLLSPIMLAAALAIRLEEPGPIFFKQWRPGFGQKPFAIYKFRTMKVNPLDDATIGTTGRNDPRITRIGAILRRLSIDELPQLLNVLKGEMSIVGPRPYVADMLVGNERFANLVRQYAARHRIRPGLTGYAQAYGMRSHALRSPDNARKSIEMDIYYITHWSLWLDIKIMVRTAFAGLAGKHVF